ncbi:hypothetical protein N7510_003541 [Penicillium lagena]|uniref:uncharacterized protein n=1 Tax=Penicillium lagena TaxID=94218 RepID=UPI0025414DD7|nr:uncharacterized protein N7510_003541 [Penicillium lagena]KAJ5619557.1 hypothetical protein N7510_003541 [Penicillium lagena]
MLRFVWLSGLSLVSASFRGPDPQIPLGLQAPGITFSSQWQILGPFRLGTREAIWGADPLEQEGGFRSRQYDPEATFNSALATNGTVKWAAIQADPDSSASRTKAVLTLSFPEVNWGFLQSVYGWSALQYQAWARGTLDIQGVEDQTVALWACGLLEFWIDGEQHFGGDIYHYRRAPSLIKLSPGPHVVDLRLTRDVRAQGGLDSSMDVLIEAELRGEPVTVDQRSLVVSELTDSKLGGIWASVHLQNNIAAPVEILSISAPKTQHRLSLERALEMAGYQTRPLVFSISLTESDTNRLTVHIEYRLAGQKDGPTMILPFDISLRERHLSEAQRFTYRHPSGGVSYAILRPPTSCNILHGPAALPVMLVLHGAGLDVDSAEARAMLDGAYGVCAWMLFPSGVTSWSGDDWHHWGNADAQAALSAIPEWMANVGWKGPSASLHDLILIGHSNGGQGAWYYATHYPDQVAAVAPVSGYTSIENYVPYSMWQNLEPSLLSVLLRSRASYKHELLLENLAGIPVVQQHGSDDDNVPAYHSRLIHELLDQISWPSKYNELLGAGHWFPGVLTTPFLQQFYHDMATSPRTSTEIPDNFTIAIPATGVIGSKAGIQVDQLQSPDQNGEMAITRHPESRTWDVRCRNIRRFHLADVARQIEVPDVVILGDTHFVVDHDQLGQTWYLQDNLGEWTASHDPSWRLISGRYGRQLGGIDAMLRSDGRVQINLCSAGVQDVAIQISRNLVQYFSADADIVRGCFPDGPGNAITLAMGNDLPPSQLDTYPIHPDQGRLLVSSPQSPPQGYAYEPGLGAVFLRPLADERVELVVWGADVAGLRQAARLVPTVTGGGQPDYAVLGDEGRWRGAAGVLAAGHLDWSWQVSRSSFSSTSLGSEVPRSKKQKLEHMNADSLAGPPSGLERILAKLSPKEALASTSPSSQNTSTPDLLPPQDIADTSELLRLKQELLAANSKIACQEQELAQTRVIKHTLDQALGPPSEVDFGGGHEITEQTTSHLQNAFNASNPTTFTQVQDPWHAQDDSQSDISDALSAGAYNRTRGLWSQHGQQSLGVGTNGTAFDNTYEALPGSSNSLGQDPTRFWGSSTFASRGALPSHRVFSGPSYGFQSRPLVSIFGLFQLQISALVESSPKEPAARLRFQPLPLFGVGFLTDLSQLGVYPIPYQTPSVGTPLSPTATEFTSASSNATSWATSRTCGDSIQTYMSPLEPLNYRRLLDKNVSCDWKYIVDKIVCNNDQQASIFLQQKLKVGTTELKYDIIEAIVNQAYPLMVNRFGNFLIQRCFEHGTPEQVVAIANAIRGNTLNLSMDPFGCHVIQKAFDCVSEEHKAVMVHELLRRIPETRPAIEEVLGKIDVLARGQFGNWCIQHICEHGAPHDKSRAIEHVLHWAVDYSMDQFASKIVEKCLKIGGSEFLELYLSRVCTGRADRPRMPLTDIAGDQYGNYLIQWILMNAAAHQRELVASHIRKHMVSLRGSKFGSRVAMLCCNPSHATRPGPGAGMQIGRFNQFTEDRLSNTSQPSGRFGRGGPWGPTYTPFR